MNTDKQTFLLVGCPNAGKSSIFNLLTGSDRKVANYSGVTVDIGHAPLRSNAVFDQKIDLIDLPEFIILMLKVKMKLLLFQL